MAKLTKAEKDYVCKHIMRIAGEKEPPLDIEEPDVEEALYAAVLQGTAQVKQAPKIRQAVKDKDDRFQIRLSLEDVFVVPAAVKKQITKYENFYRRAEATHNRTMEYAQQLCHAVQLNQLDGVEAIEKMKAYNP